MRHTLRFVACDDGSVLLEERSLAYGLACGYERGATELGVHTGRRVRMELLDDAGRLLDWRTYLAAVTGRPFPTQSGDGQVTIGSLAGSAPVDGVTREGAARPG